jgi:integral membrane protein (TIGR01906 family)
VIARLSSILSLPVLIFLTSLFLVMNLEPFYSLSPHPGPAMEIAGFIMGGRLYLDTTQAELSHLADVRELMTSLKVLWISSLIVLISSLTAFPTGRRWAYLLWPEIATISLGIILAGLGISFTLTFDVFHSLLFKPGTFAFQEGSLLIEVFPVEFFMTAYLIIIATAMTATLAMLAITLLSRRKAAGYL